MNHNKTVYIILAAALAIGLLSLSTHGIWMDEAVRIQVANLSVEDGYWSHCYDHLQVGLCHLQYLWSLVFPKTEFCYRAMNLPFLLICCLYLFSILRHHKLSPWWILLFCAHPFICYYNNDASPYIILMACSCGAYYHAFYAESRSSARNICAILAWLLFGFFVHFIFGFAFILYLSYLFTEIYRNRDIPHIRRQLIIGLIFAPLFAYLAYMYMQHMMHGANRGWDKPGIFNLGSAGYAFLGMSGLGLPRNDIRAGNFHLITPAMIALPSIACLAFSLILFAARKKLASIFKNPDIRTAIILCAVFYAGSYSRNFQFWERHLTFLFLPFFIVLVLALQHTWNTGKAVYRGGVLLFIVLLLISSSQLRWNKIYQKDDHKGALLYLKERGYLNSDVPILAQGRLYLYNYYNCKDYFGEIPQPPQNILHADSWKEDRFLSTVESLSQQHPEIILLLTEKDAPKDFYDNAERIFRSKGFEVTSTTEFNTIKMLSLRQSSEPSPFTNP